MWEQIGASLAELYRRMEEAYALEAEKLGLSCDGCADNCCTSYFLHYTRVEWAYLHQGLDLCPPEKRRAFEERAARYVARSAPYLEKGRPPKIMCPLNEDGRCVLYAHRMMICRLHGVPNFFEKPDGSVLRFPGCVRCQGLYTDLDSVDLMDRTPFYRKLAALEKELAAWRPPTGPRVRLTLAEMILSPPPFLR